MKWRAISLGRLGVILFAILALSVASAQQTKTPAPSGSDSDKVGKILQDPQNKVPDPGGRDDPSCKSFQAIYERNGCDQSCTDFCRSIAASMENCPVFNRLQCR